MNVKIVVMSNIFDIKGNLDFDRQESMLNDSLSFVQEYINADMLKTYEGRLVGKYPKKDITGDIRRCIMFLFLVRKEIDFNESVGNGITANEVLLKYDVESYRDYLVCRGIDFQIIDGLFDTFDLNVVIESDTSTDTGDTGIGNMQIEGDSNPFTIF